MTESSINSAEWFLRSGIQEENGGVARYYLSDRRRNAPISSEITGYFASALVDLHRRDSSNGFAVAGQKAAAFLSDVAWDDHQSAMPFECEPEGNRYSYFFDNGIIARGLLAVWRQSSREELLQLAVKCGESMARDFAQEPDFCPIIELPAKTPLAYQPARWSRTPGCYQLKAALAWYELWLATGTRRFLALYEKMLASSLASHDSFLPGSATELPVMDRLHAYCYFLEGLLPAIDEPECAAALAKGINRTAMFMRSIAPRFLRSDVIAQLLRARLFADVLGAAPLDKKSAAQEAAMLREFQSEDDDVRLKGGFWFGRQGSEMLPFMNPWSTAFSSQTLQMWEQYQAGDRQLEWQSLV